MQLCDIYCCNLKSIFSVIISNAEKGRCVIMLIMAITIVILLLLDYCWFFDDGDDDGHEPYHVAEICHARSFGCAYPWLVL